jgi:hypothetical protein
MNRSELTWNEIEDITRGRFGETSAVCPFCSAGRRTAEKRKRKVLSVKLLKPDFAVFHFNHCEAGGYCRPNRASRPVIDLAEQRRRREQARRHTEAEKQDRTRRALELWDESLPFRGSPAELYLRRSRYIGDWSTPAICSMKICAFTQTARSATSGSRAWSHWCATS